MSRLHISDLPPNVQVKLKTGQAAFSPSAAFSEDLARATDAEMRGKGPARIVKPTTSKKLHAEFQKVRVAAFFFRWYIPQPAAEHRFDPDRLWRFDYAWTDHKVALEVEGGVWTGGRHTRGAGFLKDMEKYNRATVLGWRVFRVQPCDLMTPTTAKMLQEAMKKAA